MARSPIQWMLMPLRRYFQVNGRASRAEFFWFLLFAGLMGLLTAGIDIALFFAGVAPVSWLLFIALLPPNCAVAVRRLHDVGRSGWWLALAAVLFSGAFAATAAAMTYGMPTSMLSAFAILLFIAGFAVGIVVLVSYCTPGTAGPNRFGDDPLRP